MPTINQLNSITTLSGGDLLPVYSSGNGDARKVSVDALSQHVGASVSFVDAVQTQYKAPTTGQTVTLDSVQGALWLILTPAAGLAALTLLLPPSDQCLDHQEVTVNSTQAVTTLTTSGNGAAIVGAPTTLAANAFFRLRFDLVMQTWYRIG